MPKPRSLIRVFTAAPVTVALVYAMLSSACAIQQSRALPIAPMAAQETVALPDLPAEAREPQVSVDTRGNVYVGFGAGDALYCSVSQDGGKTYAAPVKVAQTGKLSLGMRRGPRIAVVGASVVLSAIYGVQGKGRDGELLAWRSTNGGKTWAGPARVSDEPGAAREGLHAMASSPDGKTLACTWLDLRAKGTQLYLALSRDGGATWTKNTPVYASPDGTICECCHPSITFGPDGELLIMWRNWLGGSRDMYLARSRDGGKTFSAAEKLGAGTWPLNACPMDGGALTVAPDGAIMTIWRRNQEMFTCAPGKEEQLLGKGQQGWAVTGPDGTYSVWIVGRPGQLTVRRPGATSAVSIATNADDPAVAAAPGGKRPVVVVWTNGKGADTSVRTTVLH